MLQKTCASECAYVQECLKLRSEVSCLWPFRINRLGRKSDRATRVKSVQFANERAIILARLPLAIGAMAGTFFNPTQPDQPGIAYPFLVGYVAFALLLLSTYRRPRSNFWNVCTHCSEVMFLSFLIPATDGFSSPFFLFFSFVVLAAALRWQWLGALVTGAALSGSIMVISWAGLFTHLSSIETGNLILRNSYLVVVSVLFAFLGNQFYRSSQQAERLQLAQNLHDGLLQALTAIRLTLAQGTSDRDRAQNACFEAGRVLAQEQQRVREFVSETRDRNASRSSHQGQVSSVDLNAVFRQLEKLWGCEIQSKVYPTHAAITPDVVQALTRLFSEAVANAVFHGEASKVHIEIKVLEREIAVRIRDNGKGLPNQEGEFTHIQLRSSNIGPRSIRDRIEALGGQLRLASSGHGLSLDFNVPKYQQE